MNYTLEENYVVLDIETTGLSKINDDIIEFGMVKVIDGKHVGNIQQFVKPTKRISSRITNLTGITNEMVAGAEPIEKILPKFQAYIGNLPIVVHNKGFDINFINQKLEMYGFKLITNDVIDTLQLARKYGQTANCKLETLRQYYNLNYANSHRAHDDALLTMHVYRNLINSLNDQSDRYTELYDKYIGEITNGAGNLEIKDGNDDLRNIDLESCLFNLTGKFKNMTQSKLKTKLLQYGLQVDRLQVGTNYLVVGDKTTEINQGIIKAVKFNCSGSEIKLIWESDLLHILESRQQPPKQNLFSIDVEDKHVSLTGQFSEYERNQVENMLLTSGAIIKDKVTANTEILLVGDSPSIKLEKAKQLGIKIYTEEQAFIK